MNCPNCRTDLEDHILQGKIYHKCPSCGGLWFDKGELALLMQEKDWFKIDSKHSDASSYINTGNLPCPRDSNTMHTIKYSHESGVNINLCSLCEGLWLNAGDIYDIHKAGETWIERIRDIIEEELTAVELFLIKIGPYLPR